MSRQRHYFTRPWYWLFLNLLGATYGGCMKCGDKWSWKVEHSIETFSHGMFPCCEECWRKISDEERIHYVNRLCDDWLRTGLSLQETEDRRNEAIDLIRKGEPYNSSSYCWCGYQAQTVGCHGDISFSICWKGHIHVTSFTQKFKPQYVTKEEFEQMKKLEERGGSGFAVTLTEM